jgi:hypothetical protein
MAEKKIIDLVIRDNVPETEGHLKDLSGQLKTSKKDVNTFEDSVDSLGDSMINLDASFEEVYGDLKPLTARMGEAEDRLYELALAGKQGTTEFNALLATVGNYRKTQIQTDLAVDAAATTLTQKLGGSLEFVSGAFASTQGAIALFGKENKDVEKAILKVQSALAITQGFAAMREGANSVRQLGTAIKSLTLFQTAYNFINNATSTGLKVLRGALIGTGIGALVVGVGLLIANFDKLKAMALKLVPSLALIGKVIGGAYDSFTDFVGLTTEAGRAMQKLQETAEKTLKSNAKFLKEHGTQIDEYTKQKIEAKNEYYEALKDDTADQVALAKELNRKLAKITADRNKADKEKQDALQKERDDKQKDRIQKEADRFNEQVQQEGEAQMARYEEELKLLEAFERGKAKITQKTTQESQTQTNTIVKNAMDKSLEDAKKYSENQLALAQAEADGKRALLAITAQALGQFSELLGRQTAEGKALAVASATINAYLAISEVWKAPNPYPEPFGTATKVASTVVVGAAAFKSISDILAVQVPGGGGGGGSASAPPASPRFNVVGASPDSANQIANTIGSDLPVVKAYVVANDVTTAQSLDRNIVSSASLG